MAASLLFSEEKHCQTKIAKLTLVMFKLWAGLAWVPKETARIFTSVRAD